MIKEEYIGKEVTIRDGYGKHKIEIYEGMTLRDIEKLKAHGVDVLEPIEEKPKPTRKKKKVKMVEPDPETEQENKENGEE